MSNALGESKLRSFCPGNDTAIFDLNRIGDSFVYQEMWNIAQRRQGAAVFEGLVGDHDMNLTHNSLSLLIPLARRVSGSHISGSEESEPRFV